MATIGIPQRYDTAAVLLADDEPEHLEWLVDYLQTKGCRTTIVTNVRDAINAAQQQTYRTYIIDLNIPLGEWKPSFQQSGAAYEDYHGLYIIKLVRSQGIEGRRVIAYSAHHNEVIVSAMTRLYCRYLVKGRPRELKVEIDALLKQEPRAKPQAKKVKVHLPGRKKRQVTVKKKTQRASRYRKPERVKVRSRSR